MSLDKEIVTFAEASADIFNGVLKVATDANRANRFSPLWNKALGDIAIQAWQHCKGHSKTINLQTFFGVEGFLDFDDKHTPEVQASDMTLTYGKLKPRGERDEFYMHPIASGDEVKMTDVRAALKFALGVRAALKEENVEYRDLNTINLGHLDNDITASIWFPDEDSRIMMPKPVDTTWQQGAKGASVINLAEWRRRRIGRPPGFDPAS